MKPENNSWKLIQYRGDAADISELYEKYNVDGFLSAREANEQQAAGGLRERLLKDGVLLNDVLSPRIYAVLRRVQERLKVSGNFDVFCLRDHDVNAFAQLDLSSGRSQHVIGITSGALESLEDAEIASLLGHELGHVVFDHTRLLGLLNNDESNSRITVLPYMGECLFLRWRKKCEISADRLGLIASGSFEATARALLKAGFGLSARNLNLDVEALLSQIEAIKDKPEILEAAYRSHPLMPLRIKALHLFNNAGRLENQDAQSQVDGEIDNLFDWFRRYPRKPLHQAVMRIVAHAGMKLAGVEKDVDEEEIRTIIYVLHNHFTDEPEKELILEPAERERRWREALEVLRRDGDEDDLIFIISRLADIALADGKLLEMEAGVILEVAEQIGISSKRAYAIMVGAAQIVGFKVDSQMKELTRKVRNQFMEGMAVGL